MPISEIEVARRLNLAGFLFLPWLWLVSSLHFYEAAKTNPEIAYYVRRNMIGFFVYTALFLAWLIVFQLNWRNWAQMGKDLLVVPIREEEVIEW